MTKEAVDTGLSSRSFWSKTAVKNAGRAKGKTEFPLQEDHFLNSFLTFILMRESRERLDLTAQ